METDSLLYTVVTLVAGWLGWRQRADLTRVANAAFKGLKGFVAKRSPQDRSSLKATISRIFSRRAGEEQDKRVEQDETVVIRRGGSLGTLTCLEGALKGKQWDILAHGLGIGRDPQSVDVVIDDPRISAKHVEICERQGELFVVDHDSKNGVFIIRRISKEARLVPEDIVMLPAKGGDQKFIYNK